MTRIDQISARAFLALALNVLIAPATAQSPPQAGTPPPEVESPQLPPEAPKPAPIIERPLPTEPPPVVQKPAAPPPRPVVEKPKPPAPAIAEKPKPAAPKPRGECVIKPVMSEDDLWNCSAPAKPASLEALPPPASVPKPSAAPVERPQQQQRTECVIKPVMTDEEMRACGSQR